jgi:hypothetical protein
MRKLAVFLLVANLLHLWLVLPIGDLLDGRSMVVYPFVIPHLCVLLVVLALLAFLTIKPQSSIAVVVLTVVGLFATLATAAFAMTKWPGGDDGGGIFWLLFVGGFSLLNVGAALALPWLATKQRGKSSGPLAQSARR